MEKFEVLTILNVILLIAFFFILYKIFIYTRRVQGIKISLIVVGFIIIVAPKNCQSVAKDDLQNIINDVNTKKELRKKYKVFKLENHHSHNFQNLQVGYLVYFDEGNNLKIFDERVGLTGFVLGTEFDEIPIFTSIEKLSNGSYQITSELHYHSFFFSDTYIMQKTFSAEEIKKTSSKEGQEYFIHYPKFEKPTYHY